MKNAQAVDSWFGVGSTPCDWSTPPIIGDEYIHPTDMDDEVSFDAVWMQGMIDGGACCCPGIGQRGVAVIH